MQVRLNRLQADFAAMRSLVRGCSAIRVKSVQGDPPEKYRILLAVRSLTRSGATLRISDEHLMEVRLPLGYPRDAPVCRMLTPVFHPNIAPHAVCIGDHWSAGESLDALVLRVCEMLAFQSYNLHSPLNGDAAQWVHQHLDELPLDPRSFILAELDASLEPPAAEEAPATCANCGDLVGADGATCAVGHRLCKNCLERCPSCGATLCLSCDELLCAQCA